MDVVDNGARLRKRETEVREGKIKNDKERIFKWNVKKIEILMEVML